MQFWHAKMPVPHPPRDTHVVHTEGFWGGKGGGKCKLRARKQVETGARGKRQAAASRSAAVRKSSFNATLMWAP